MQRQNPPEPEQLISKSQEGDGAAFAQWFQLHRQRLTTQVRTRMEPMLRSRLDASDVVQDVFMEANRRLSELADCDVPLETWLQTLFKQRMIDLQRRHLYAAKRSVAKERPLRDVEEISLLAQQLIADISSPSFKANRHELQQRVHVLMEQLPAIDREVLSLRHFESKTNLEVAEALGLSANAASNRYVRALQRLRTLVGEVNRESAE